MKSAIPRREPTSTNMSEEEKVHVGDCGGHQHNVVKPIHALTRQLEEELAEQQVNGLVPETALADIDTDLIPFDVTETKKMLLLSTQIAVFSQALSDLYHDGLLSVPEVFNEKYGPEMGFYEWCREFVHTTFGLNSFKLQQEQTKLQQFLEELGG